MTTVMQYELVIDIPPDDLQALQTRGDKIVFGHPIHRNPPNLIWLARHPQAHNRLSWIERYGIWTASHLELGRPVRPQHHRSPIELGRTYPVRDTIGDPEKRCDKRKVMIRNETDRAIYTGLSLKADWNGESIEAPLDAHYLAPGEALTMEPCFYWYLWVQQDAEDLTHVDPKNMLSCINMGFGINQVHVRYEDDRKQFILTKCPIPEYSISYLKSYLPKG